MDNILFQHYLKLFLLVLIQLLTIVLLSPLVNSLIKKVEALFQGRQGPPLLQSYYDLIKYFHKDTVVSNQVSWIFFATPFIMLVSVLLASFTVPLFFISNSFNVFGGIIFLVSILSLGRFFMALSAMEPGSGFCGMASSREMMLALLVEPVLLLALFVLVVISGSMNLSLIVDFISKMGLGLYSPGYILAVIALTVIVTAEMGRVPFDNPETHYELTMIHEGMLLEYSGKQLGLMFLSSWIKQLLVLSLLANIVFPWGLATNFNIKQIVFALFFYFVKILFLCVFFAFIETVFAKVRLFRVKDILITSFVTSIIALVLIVKHNSGGF